MHSTCHQEIRYRQRYLDLLVNEQSRSVFKLRAHVRQPVVCCTVPSYSPSGLQVIRVLRRLLEEHLFMEVCHVWVLDL